MVLMKILASLLLLPVRTKPNMLVGCDQKSSMEKVKIRECDNPKMLQFFMCMFFGVNFESIASEHLLVAKQAAA